MNTPESPYLNTRREFMKTGGRIAAVHNHDHEFAPGVDQLTLDGPAPLKAADGKYPVPQPGISRKREYEEAGA